MTNYSAARVKSATLTANTVDVVTLGRPYSRIEIANRSTTDDVWVTVDRGQDNSVTVTPTVGGDNVYFIFPGGVRDLRDDPASNAPLSIVRLISSGAAPYTVTGHDPVI